MDVEHKIFSDIYEKKQNNHLSSSQLNDIYWLLS